ncbi:beta-ketoacyl-[acyl-carrier-protein] synthase family protein [Kitasatospora sp. NBC_01560]|uniref:beta-ketoacyl synthase N-terminal-like domain-containing protein n=1 Tax=Kitasatospora sp. NBC_01560 TaxID=2975965 RepID=UPI00386870CB
MPRPIRPDDVCITGMAWNTPLGDTLDGVWQRLLAGDSGVADTPSAHPVRTTLAATVPGLPQESAGARQTALAAGVLTGAFDAAGLDPAGPGVRVVLGTSFGPLLDEPFEAADDWAVAAAGRAGHPHRPVSVSTACSAGADSVLLAAELVRAGWADACVAGGVDVLTPAKRLGHTALGTMSEDRLRAFDERHSGMLLGEGAAALVLERASSARARSAPVLAVLSGAGSANDATGLTAPDPSGESVVLAVRRCLAAAGRTPQEVAVLNAHATGTVVNDAVESTSLARLFGGAERAPLVFATKGALGHSLGATGAIEAVSVVLALRDGRVPAVHGLERPMAGFPLPLAVGGPTRFEGGLGASLTIGFGGFNTCLLFERAGR